MLSKNKYEILPPTNTLYVTHTHMQACMRASESYSMQYAWIPFKKYSISVIFLFLSFFETIALYMLPVAIYQWLWPCVAIWCVCKDVDSSLFCISICGIGTLSVWVHVHRTHWLLSFNNNYIPDFEYISSVFYSSIQKRNDSVFMRYKVKIILCMHSFNALNSQF